MFHHFQNIDLDFLFEKEGSLSGFVTKVMSMAKVISGYRSFYLYSSIGDPEFEITVDIDDENKEIELSSMQAHVCGDNVWEMAVASDITEKDANKMTKSIVFRNAETGEGLVPVGIRFSDVLPSYLPDDIIKMQIIAFAESIDIYENEEAYFASCEKDSDGNITEPGDGVIFPSGLFYNRTESEEDDEENDKSLTDLICVLRSTVKRVEKGAMTNWWKTEDEQEQNFHTFYFVTVGTLYGDLDIIVGVKQITPEQEKLLKAGSVIRFAVTLSGDVVIDEFENGAVFNEECDLRLIRQGIVKGDTDRIICALNENVSFEFPSEDISVTGKGETFRAFENYCKSKETFVTALCTASVVFDDESVDFTSAKRAVAVSYGGEVAEHLIFIDTNENGKIVKIKIVSALGFDVKIDTPEYEYDDDIYGEEGFEELN